MNASRFDAPWWFRAPLPASAFNRARGAPPPVLTFNGLNYRAELWVDGQRLAGPEQLVGPFRRFEVPLSSSPSADAAIALRIWRQHDRALPPNNNDTDLGISFVDWAPAPPDGNLGLIRRVQLFCPTLPLLLSDPAASVALSHAVAPGSATARVDVTVAVTASNLGRTQLSGALRIRLGDAVDVTVSGIEVPPGPAAVTLRVVPTAHPALTGAGPLPLWWPWRMGAAALVNLTVTFIAESNANAHAHAHADGDLDGDAHGDLAADDNAIPVDSARGEREVLSTSATAAVGLRHVTATLDSAGSRLFRVNGHRLAIFGGGYSPDLFLRHAPAWQARHLQLARDLGLNALRLEGKMEDDAFYAEADRLGLVVLTGWCCCDAWQHWTAWGEEQHVVANASLATQVRRLRVHPSAVAFFYGSDEAPPPPIEADFLRVFEAEAWMDGVVAAASALTTPGGGPTGVKMAGPYAW